MIIISKNTEDTLNLGIDIGKLCKGGEIIALSGELGAGKTAFTKGVGAGLGIKSNIVSPTFMLVRTYQGTILKLIHFDFYRLDNADDFYSIGFEDFLEKDSVIVIEWAEKFISVIPKPLLKMDIIVQPNEERTINVELLGELPQIENYLKRRGADED